MRHHDHDHGEPGTEAVARSRPEALDAVAVRAAAAGRTDVLRSTGLAGIQRAAGNGAAAAVQRAAVHDVVHGGGGSPLDAGTRADLEGRMGHDFGDVRVHTGDAADASARSVSAHAYTVGSNIVFQRGAYDPGSTAGRTLLAHELTHVVQQRSGPVDGTPTAGGVSVSSPTDRFEVEAAANAERVMAQPAPAMTAAPAPAAGSGSAPAAAGTAVQRQEAEEEESAQAAHDPSLGPVQRAEAEEEEAPA